MDGLDELPGIASGEIGATNGTGKKCISGEDQGLLRKIEADAALGMTGSMQNGAAQPGDGYGLAVFEAGVGWGDFGRGNAEPSGLYVHHLYQGQVVLVVEDGRAGEALEPLGSCDVVDVGMGHNDLLDGELKLFKGIHNTGDVVARINHNGFMGGFIAENGAIALEWADDEDFVDHGLKTNS